MNKGQPHSVTYVIKMDICVVLSLEAVSAAVLPMKGIVTTLF